VAKLSPTDHNLVICISLEDSFARHLNKFAYRNGTSTDLLRRVGAIYLRDTAVAPN
jgi:hypothetical protein